MKPQTVSPKVHQRRGSRLDRILDFVAFAARPMPLVRLLDEAPQRIAAIVSADVCSLYVLEGEHDLVMRGNVGFSRRALGRVHLKIGEGVTGQAVEYLRPISLTMASEHDAYRAFREIDEERYPVFLAVPIFRKSGPLGALVVQRKGDAFTESDIELLTVLGALIAAGIRHAELIDSQRERSANSRRTGGGTRKVTLPGRPVVPGAALGAVAALRRPASRTAPDSVEPVVGEPGVRLLKGAFDVAQKAISAIGSRAKALELGQSAAFLGTYVEILEDQRFRSVVSDLVADGTPIPRALADVARTATRTATTVSPDPFLEERAKDVEDLCDALIMLAATDKRAELPLKCILVGDQLSVFDVLISARAQPVGIALSDRALGPRTETLLRLMGVPSVVGIHGLFRWCADGDIALLDADHGLFVVNPSKSEIMSVRKRKRDQSEV